MRPCLSLCLFLSLILVACATPRLPEIPEYHPASARAPEAAGAPLFDILNVAPLVPPVLPVPEGEHHAPQMDGVGMQHGEMPMQHDGNDASEETQQPDHEMKRNGKQHEESRHATHGVVLRPGMKSGEAQPKSFEQRIKRGEADMDVIVIPSEQRGMQTDETLYHEHEAPYSTKIVHPRRGPHLQPVESEQIWVCPTHPKVTVVTPGGRCPRCRSVLVPVRVPENG